MIDNLYRIEAIGGLGFDIWDDEFEIIAPNMAAALIAAEAKMRGIHQGGGEIVLIERIEPVDVGDLFAALDAGDKQDRPIAAKEADRIDGLDRDDLGESPDF